MNIKRIGKSLINKAQSLFKTKLENTKIKWNNLIKNIYKNRQYYYLMAPYAILFLLFTIIPVFMSLGISFTYFNLLEPPKFVGWDNYKRLFLEDDVFIIAIKNTLILAVITGPVSYLAAFVFAWLINELPPKLRSFMTLIFYAPSISGNAYIIWLLIFSSDGYGYANATLRRFGFINEAIQWLQDPNYILWIIIIVQLWLSLGVSFLAFIAGLQGVNKTLYEAGVIDGIKNRWQELWYITLPSMKPQLMFGAVIQITTTLSVADVAMKIAGFPSIQYAGHTIVTHLIDYGTIRFDMGYASTIATILFIIMFGTNLLVRNILRRVGN
ncbi:carbohydrate ABC transporter permease [Haloplasma contractile]|uniref:Binding-protein-dependent transport systems inner membrane component n=1 Tax=Haloplasma contractile SSD-17B TaxID=1033810 RepID=F7PRD9_9MOLU|nr:sugar ABC transporter permease [Haloplasma contractile]ERJ11735.1 Binding-protein-dependent transport systems inner membrane component [Haloplasma contractile SSD-17B]